MKFATHHSSGYTLLEALLSLSIFLIVIVPLVSAAGRTGTKLEHERQRVVAIGLLEQECARIRLAPDNALPEKRIQASGRQWLIRTERRGEGLRRYVVSVWLDRKMMADGVMYVRE